MPEAKVRGYTPRRFSFNQAGGRCEACEGAGQKRIEMHFLPDVWVTCDACDGPEVHARDPRGEVPRQDDRRRPDDETSTPPSNSSPACPSSARSCRPCTTSASATSPSASPPPRSPGGEAQRVKLAAELARPDTGKTLYVLDEPTTGLHLDDTRKLLAVVHRLADLGNTVVIIEHNLEVIKTADWLIDIGPEAGAEGGIDRRRRPPEAIAKAEGLPHRRHPQGRCPRRRPPRRAARGSTPNRPRGR